MKRTQSVAALLLTGILVITFAASRVTSASARQRFVIDEYEFFYVLLGQLQREALPERDFQRIRSYTDELVARGKAIVKLRLRKGVKSEEFSDARRNFDRALNAFKSDARKNDDSRLSRSFAALHDSFEKLVDEAPRVYQPHPPPIVSVSVCRNNNPVPEGELIITAYATPNFDALKQGFVWTISGGKIVDGQGTSQVTIDTTGLAGQKIMVTMGVNDGNQHTMYNTCEVLIAASKEP
jgi:hypothetical protein